MLNKRSVLASAFAAIAAAVFYEFLPHKVEVNVVSIDRVLYGEKETARYLRTDQGQPATMKDASRFPFPRSGIYSKPVKAICIQSRDWRGGPPALHDCEPQ